MPGQPYEDTVRNGYGPGNRTSPDIKSSNTLVLDFPGPRTGRREISVVSKSFSLWNFVKTANACRHIFNMPKNHEDKEIRRLFQ